MIHALKNAISKRSVAGGILKLQRRPGFYEAWTHERLGGVLGSAGADLDS